MHNKLSNDQP